MTSLSCRTDYQDQEKSNADNYEETKKEFIESFIEHVSIVHLRHSSLMRINTAQ